ncbi:MAG: hypothetical protein KDD42_02275 [Bdellovibrionales bacterium]|nr:hypothetical protein [Bdellovibrionales bacterium]
MRQLNLDLPLRLPYEPHNFLLHTGVKDVYKRLSALDLLPHLIYVQAAPRSGKTHCAVALHDTLSVHGTVSLITAFDFAELLQGADTHNVLRCQTVLVDDADLYLGSLGEGDSGGFVNFAEMFKLSNRRVLLFGSATFEDFQADEHVMSRLRGGEYLEIQDPGEAELPELLNLMLIQRGMRLSQTKRSFLLKRLVRNIPAIDQALNHLARDNQSSMGALRASIDPGES